MKIKVEPLYPTGSFLNCRISIEKDFQENANPEEAVNYLWDITTAIHMKRYPHLYSPEGKPLYEGYKGEENGSNSIPTSISRDVVEPIDKTIQGIIEDIGNCTAFSKKNGIGVEVGLLAYKEMATKYPDVQEAYIKKVKELAP